MAAIHHTQHRASTQLPRHRTAAAAARSSSALTVLHRRWAQPARPLNVQRPAVTRPAAARTLFGTLPFMRSLSGVQRSAALCGMYGAGRKVRRLISHPVRVPCPVRSRAEDCGGRPLTHRPICASLIRTAAATECLPQQPAAAISSRGRCGAGMHTRSTRVNKTPLLRSAPCGQDPHLDTAAWPAGTGTCGCLLGQAMAWHGKARQRDDACAGPEAFPIEHLLRDPPSPFLSFPCGCNHYHGRPLPLECVHGDP